MKITQENIIEKIKEFKDVYKNYPEFDDNRFDQEMETLSKNIITILEKEPYEKYDSEKCNFRIPSVGMISLNRDKQKFELNALGVIDGFEKHYISFYDDQKWYSLTTDKNNIDDEYCERKRIEYGNGFVKIRNQIQLATIELDDPDANHLGYIKQNKPAYENNMDELFKENKCYGVVNLGYSIETRCTYFNCGIIKRNSYSTSLTFAVLDD